ncbi:MAG: hypothetical protein J5379_04660 [Clostridiales bacterium]|nr:hypothetical protein [Clostridiales bacterium]
MIKEIKVNLYRVFRSKSFYIIVSILIIGALLSSLLLKFCADDPFQFFSEFSKEIMEGVTDEEERATYGSLLSSIDRFREMNNLTGVMRLSVCSELVCFLHCIFVSLFVAGEFKSRFHVNHYSLTADPGKIVFLEWLTLISVIILVEVVCYCAALGLAVALCNTFTFDDVSQMLGCGAIMLGVIIAHSSFAFMISYIRKASPLAIVLSSLFTFGVLDLVFAIGSIWIPWFQYLALNSTVSALGLLTMQQTEMIGVGIAIVGYIAVFLSITMVVAAKRDPY